MQYKQAQAVLSDFLLKCEDEGVALPADPLDAVVAAVRALSHEAKHEVGRPQMEAAMAAMRHQYGVVQKSGHGGSLSPRPSSNSMTNQTEDKGDHAFDGDSTSPSPPPPPPQAQTQQPHQQPSRKRAAGKSVSKIQSDVVSKRAKCSENQPLVDQLVQLGEFELESGHTQRGVTRMRAAKQIRDADDAITSGAQARQLDRVGPSAAAKIDAILHGGLEHAMREYE